MKEKEETYKEIDQKALVRIFTDVKNKKNSDIRFCFLTGAGASKSSGIPLADELSKKWYKELLEDGLIQDKEIEKWKKDEKVDDFEANIACFYPYLYEKRFKACPETGYEEIISLMENKEPSIGYAILSNILAQEKHNFVITTNFDYLIEDSVNMFTSAKPFSAGHEITAQFISVNAERPTIIKVHRDLFLHPFNDSDSTNKLKEEWKPILSPILNNFHLLVIGYGGNDGSLMTYLKDTDTKNRKPVYWCVTDKNKLNSKITDLLEEKDFIVTIKSFDDLMYALYKALNYQFLEKLDKPDEHQFVLNVKKKIENMQSQLNEILEKEKDNKEVSEDVKGIIKSGPLEYKLKANSEKDTDKKEDIYKEGIEKYPDEPWLYEAYGSFLYETALEKLAENRENKEADKLLKSARDNYEKALSIKPDFHQALNNWGIALFELAKLKKNDEADTLLKSAREKYENAINIKPDLHEAFYNWGLALYELAKLKKGEEAENLLKSAIVKYENAINIKPDSPEAFDNWGNALSDLAKLKKGEEADKLLKSALDKYKKALENGGKCYNLACFYSLKQEKENALHYLEISLSKKEITADFVSKDEDWNNYKDDPDFQNLINRYQS